MTGDSAPAVVAARYEVIRPLGHGSFGRTFLAHDRELDREVALKLFDVRGAADWKALELFEREAAVLRGLRHQGIPAVYETLRDAWDGAPAIFLVMEYIQGISLAQMIEAKQSLEEAEVVTSFLELLGILEYLHTRVPPILHRDIKPANILVRPNGLPALVDFGSVRRILMGPEESGSTIAGTYGYMPYEQYMGQATQSSDLYALAATFLHLLSGRPPRDFMNDDGRISVPERLTTDPRLQPIIARMLRPSPADRFATAHQVRQALLSPVAVQISSERRPLPTVRASAIPVTLPPAPRAVEGATADLFARVTPSAWEMMDTSSKPGESVSLLDIALLTLFSVLTAGTLPAIFFSIAGARKRRLRRFFKEGVQGTGQVLKIELEPTAFGEKLARVSYEFDADGFLHRDSDRVLPLIASRWMPGDPINILYLPDRDYDSVIISTA